jgi:hypothetical protein
MDSKIRLRFAGESFPPCVVYKIFVQVKRNYISGSLRFQGGSIDAARSACNQMGVTKYREQLALDILMQTEQPFEAVNSHHAMKIVRTLDKTPVAYGGRGNDWRLLFDDDQYYIRNIVKLSPEVADDLPSSSIAMLDKLCTQPSVIRTVLSRCTENPSRAQSRISLATRQKRRKAHQSWLTSTEVPPSSTLTTSLSASDLRRVSEMDYTTYNQSSGDEMWEKEAATLVKWTENLEAENI